MLVRIKGSRLFAGFFWEVLARSRINVCSDQGLKIVCWFFFRSSCLVNNQCLFESRAQDCLLVFFWEVLARSRTNACRDQGFMIVCWFFFWEVLAQSRTNACPDQRLKIVCWFFLRIFCSIKNQCLFGSRAQDCFLVSFLEVLFP